MATILVTIWIMGAKLAGESRTPSRTVTWSQNSFSQDTYQLQRGHLFTVGKPGRPQLNQMIQGHITNTGPVAYQVPPDKMHWGHTTSMVFLPKMHNLNLIMRKHQTNPNWNVLQNNWPSFFKNIRVMKDKDWRGAAGLKRLQGHLSGSVG